MLSGLIVANPSLTQCQLALRMSYQSLGWVNAGIAFASESDELLLMRWQPRLPSPGSMTEQTDLFHSGLEIWKTAFKSAWQQRDVVSAQQESMRATAEHRMRLQILKSGERVSRSAQARN